MSFRVCAHCGIAKTIDNYGKYAARRDGISHICKECQAVKAKANYAKHAEKRKAEAKLYAAEHKEERKAYNKAYLSEHRAELAAYQKEYRATHTIILSEETKAKNREREKKRWAEDLEYRARAAERKKKHREENREAYNENQRKWVAENYAHVRAYQNTYHKNWNQTEKAKAWRAKYRLENRETLQAQGNNYRALRLGAEGSFSNTHLVHLHKWQDHCCYYCRSPLEQKDTIEHVVPLSRDGTNNPSNIVLACPSCNFSKNSRLLTEWAPAQIMDAPRQHSVHFTRTLANAIRKEGLAATVVDGIIQTENGDVLVLSSFWNQPPAPPNPNTLVIYDFEWWENPEAILMAILFGEPLPAVAPGFIGPDGYVETPDCEEPNVQGLFALEGLPERVLYIPEPESLAA